MDWPNKKDGGVKVVEKVKDGCKNPACLRPEAEAGMAIGFGDERRCGRCYGHWKLYEIEWPNKKDGGMKIVEKVKDGCKNPACLRPEAEVGQGRGLGDERRCGRCYKHQKKHKVDWPNRG
jgi:hypothetical protein